MREYLYAFDKDGVKYYIYAPSKILAIKQYLKVHGLVALPKSITIDRIKD